jgi:hypothetical protein
MSVTRQNWTSHLARLKKTFHSGKQVSPNRKKFIWENEQDDGRRDDGKRDDGKRDDGMSAPPRKRTCYDQRNSFGSASRGSIRRAERHCVLYATALEKPSQSGFEQHFVQIHPFKVDVHCWVPNVTIGLADSADEQSSWIITFWFAWIVARRSTRITRCASNSPFAPQYALSRYSAWRSLPRRPPAQMSKWGY